MKKHRIYLGLGSNLGDKETNLKEAISYLQTYGDILQVSSLYFSEPVGVKDQPYFYNAVCVLSSPLTPLALLEQTQKIEKKLGRDKKNLYEPRTIDLDILFFDAWLFYSNNLTIPHPHLAERAFVLWPLTEIAPVLKHPLWQISIEDLWLTRRKHLEKIERINTSWF